MFEQNITSSVNFIGITDEPETDIRTLAMSHIMYKIGKSWHLNVSFLVRTILNGNLWCYFQEG